MSQKKYLIVGSGLFGAVFAHEAAKRGNKATVIEQRDHLAGNIYTREIDGIKFINTEHIFSIHQTKKFGIMYNNLLNLIVILTVL